MVAGVEALRLATRARCGPVAWVRRLRRFDPDPPMTPKRFVSQTDTAAAIALVGQLGLAVALPIVIGVVGGIYARDAIGGGWGVVAMLAGILLGVGGAVAAAYRILAPFLNK